MKLTNKYILKKIGREYSLIPLSEEGISLDKIYNLNETSLFIYNLIKENNSLDEIVEKITKEYAIDEVAARNDAAEIIDFMINKEIIEKWKLNKFMSLC